MPSDPTDSPTPGTGGTAADPEALPGAVPQGADQDPVPEDSAPGDPLTGVEPQDAVGHAGVDGSAQGTESPNSVSPDPTQGVPIVPGVPLLRGPTLSIPAPSSGDITAGLPAASASSSSTDPSPADGLGDGAAQTGWQPSGSSSRASSNPGTQSGGTGPGVAVAVPIGAERTGRRGKDSGPEPASSLTADRLLAGVRRPPVSGWRRFVYTATFGRVNLGDSDAVRVQRALEHRIAVRLGDRTRYVPVLSRKGGVGKTTVTTLLGMALADVREDRIIAMDANPDRGTLSDRSPGRADHTARQLVRNRYAIESFSQLAAFVTRDGSRLHVLASDTDPTVAQAFDDSDYRAVTDLLSRYYSIVLTDSGTGMVHSVMRGTLEKADAVVLVSGGSVDEARLASETLSWLEAHDRHDLVARAIVVINLSSGNGTQVDVEQIEQHFRSRVNTVVRIPYDRHLAEGSRIELARLNPATRRAVMELAALVVDQLAS